MENTIPVALGAAAVGALVTWLIAQRRIAVENVTAERAKWRGKIRTLALQAHDAIVHGKRADVRRLKNEFRTLLNPFNAEDRKILKCMTADGPRKNRERRAKAFAKRISLLLKHDWERAKLEAGILPSQWILEAERLELDWDKGEKGKRRLEEGLQWREKYSVRWKRILVTVGVFAALGIMVCGLQNRFGVPMGENVTTQESPGAGANVGERQDEALEESADGDSGESEDGD